jgi:hypothetical protein
MVLKFILSLIIATLFIDLGNRCVNLRIDSVETEFSNPEIVLQIGQSLSTQLNVLPPAYMDALESLQNSVPAFSDEEARSIVCTELGQPIEQIFSHFSAEPVAASSLSQVSLLLSARIRPQLLCLMYFLTCIRYINTGICICTCIVVHMYKCA